MAQVLVIPTKERDSNDKERRVIHVDPDIVIEQVGHPVTWSICCPWAAEIQFVEIEFKNHANKYFLSQPDPWKCRTPVDRETGIAYIHGVVPRGLNSDDLKLPEEDKYTARALKSAVEHWAQKDPKIIKRKP